MSSLYNFKNITIVPSAATLKEVVLSKTQRKTPTVVHRHYAISRIRAFYARKVKFLQQTLHDKLSEIITQFPKMEDVHPFYADLMNILYDKDHYKIALGQMNTARNLVDGIAREYVRLLKYADSLYRCKMLKRAALGRMVKLLKRQKASFDYLEQVRQHLSRLPSIDPNTRTLLLCGFPNVGKSSLINKLTRADVDVQPYAFTTKSLYVGHLDYRYLRWQVIDTPGILDQPLEERNTIEMQAVTALAHLKAAVVFVMDISEQCDHTIAEQIQLFESIRPLFANKPVFIGLNKIDIIRREDLGAETNALLEKLEADNVRIVQLSTVSEEGVIALRDAACDTLMAHRVEQKLHSKQTAESGPLSRLFVAYPEPRDEKVRAAYVPPAVLEKRRSKMQVDLGAHRDERTRKLERELELEMGDQYVLDLKKHYLLKNPEEKYDVVPEIWEGHNIADFVDPNVVEMLKKIKDEEKLREEAGYYDEDLDSDDEETQKLLLDAQRIEAKEKLLRLEHALNKVDKPQIPRTKGRKRERTLSKLEDEMSELGVDLKKRKMSNLRAEGERPTRGGKKMGNLGRARSLSAHRATPKDQLIEDVELREKTKKIARKAQKPWQKESRKGEADRRVLTAKPKHLFSGKRGIGKTDRMKSKKKQKGADRAGKRPKPVEKKRKWNEPKGGVAKKKTRKQKKLDRQLVNLPPTAETPTTSAPKSRKPPAESLEERLTAARFRFLNEQLYTTAANEANGIFGEDADSFLAYHRGYQNQVRKWPLNPLERIIADLTKMPAGTVIADMGCGEAQIAQRLARKQLTVHSFDLVAANEHVTACNIANTPLEDESVDVVVFCLSLMGTNLGLFFREANRILRMGGKLKIAEVSSRFRNVKKFIEAVEQMGFVCKNERNLTDYFLLMNFQKNGKVQQKRPTGLILDPCLYKKR
ncbi:Nucleolar GTP-binding protein 1 [Aphelenchoides fujianensis]|nr:Nucleolar GTP-binding protein 1 [Aphelenchoides fujianensis]